MQALRSIELLSFVAHKQGPNLNQISETPTFSTLLKVMQETPYTAVMLAALLCLCMFVPWVLPSLPALLPRVFQIIKRAVCWDFGESIHDLPLKEAKKRSMSGSDMATSARSGSVPPLSRGMTSASGNSQPISPRSQSTGASSGAPASPIRRSGGPVLSNSGPAPSTAAHVSSPSSSSASTLLRKAQSSPLDHDHEQDSPPPRRSGGESSLVRPVRLDPSQPAVSTRSIPPQMRELMRRCGVVLLRLVQSLFPSSLLDFLRSECAKDTIFREAVSPMLAALRWNSWILEMDPGKELSVQRWRTVNPYQFLVDAVFGEYRTEVDRLWALNAALTSTTPVTSSHAAAATEIQLKAQIMHLQSELGIGHATDPASSAASGSAFAHTLDLASLGQTIMKLQNLLERALYVQSTSKVSRCLSLPCAMLLLTLTLRQLFLRT